MGDWRLFYTPESLNDLDKLDTEVRKRIKSKLNWIVNNFDQVTPLSLGGKWSGFFKLRVGNWKAIYNIDWESRNILVIVVGNRKDIYKRRLP